MIQILQLANKDFNLSIVHMFQKKKKRVSWTQMERRGRECPAWARWRLLLLFRSCSSLCTSFWVGLEAASSFLTLFLDHDE